MKEEFLHYVWQFQKFNSKSLQTIQGERLLLLNKGFVNTDSGPDFSNARIKINEIEWAGHVEIHLKSSDWLRHGHQHDAAYSNVILHVVWENDVDIRNFQGKEIPCLELKEITSDSVLKSYKSLMNSVSKIPCESQFAAVSEIRKVAMLDKALMQRLQRKAAIIQERLVKNTDDWQETVYQTLMANFGFKLNADPFLSLAVSLPMKLVRKYWNSGMQLEAMFFGIAGFLDSADGEYAKKIKSEYSFLKAKHGLGDSQLPTSQWKFMRTRPGNFPTVRISQMVGLFSHKKSFFDVFVEADDVDDLLSFFASKPSEYWQKHYHFEREAKNESHGMGKSSIENLIVNTVVPVQIAYANYTDNQTLTENAINLLESIKAEKNKITRFWQEMGLKIEKMTDSQGSIELHNEFCMKKKCLHCGIGAELLK